MSRPGLSTLGFYQRIRRCLGPLSSWRRRRRLCTRASPTCPGKCLEGTACSPPPALCLPPGCKSRDSTPWVRRYPLGSSDPLDTSLHGDSRRWSVLPCLFCRSKHIQLDRANSHRWCSPSRIQRDTRRTGSVRCTCACRPLRIRGHSSLALQFRTHTYTCL